MMCLSRNHYPGLGWRRVHPIADDIIHAQGFAALESGTCASFTRRAGLGKFNLLRLH